MEYGGKSRAKLEPMVDALVGSIRSVITGEKLVSFAAIDDCREKLLQLYQLHHLYQEMSLRVGAASLRVAFRVTTEIEQKLNAARNDFSTIRSWAKKVQEIAAHGRQHSGEHGTAS